MGSVKNRKAKYWKTGDKEAYKRGLRGPTGMGTKIKDFLYHVLMFTREDPSRRGTEQPSRQSDSTRSVAASVIDCPSFGTRDS